MAGYHALGNTGRTRSKYYINRICIYSPVMDRLKELIVYSSSGNIIIQNRLLCIQSESLGYIDTKTPLTLGKKLPSTKTGKAKFVISNITAHVNNRSHNAVSEEKANDP